MGNHSQGAVATDPGLPSISSFAEIAHNWRINKQVEWRISYKVSVDSILSSHLLPYFGDLPISSIGRQDVLGFRTHLASLRMGAKPEAGHEGKPLSPAKSATIAKRTKSIRHTTASRLPVQMMIDVQ